MKRAEFSRILVVKLSALGDVAHALPVLDYLRKAAPGARIDWAVDRRFAALLEGNEDLFRVVPLDLKRWKREWTAGSARKEAAGAVRELREGNYDIAFDIQGNAKSGVVTRLSGAPLRFGFDRHGVREAPNLLFTNRKVGLRPDDRHISRKLLRVVSAPFGGEFDLASLRTGIATTDEQERRAAQVVRDAFPEAAPLVVVHPGTTWQTKRMDPDFWADAARALRRRYPRIGVFLSWGSDEERREAEEILRRAGRGMAVLPRLSLKELAAVYRRCGFLMAPDTGPLHVAAAVGCRTVSVFRVTDGNRNAPYGPGHRFLQAPMPCTACLRKRCARDAECRRSIPPEAAAEAMATLLVEMPGV
ncbi:MAG: lipopolysaccharide heptosyltransferase I [Deltaproteobacteria bacterium]|nr:lipopolysaccharide heptosyltransferase I [Deltaproteobacteria bacterium]